MTDQPQPQDVPDVEAIIADLRRSIKEAEEVFERESAPPPGGPTPEQIAQGARAENNLYDNLHAANLACRVGVLPDASGLKAMARRRTYEVLAPLIGELNEFHTRTVRVLNKMVKILDGNDTAISSELLMKTQRRIDLLTQLCNRLAAYDELQIEARLRKIEEELARLRAREGA